MNTQSSWMREILGYISRSIRYFTRFLRMVTLPLIVRSLSRKSMPHHFQKKAGCPEFICKECGVAREKILETIFMPKPTNDKPESYRAIQEEQKGNRSIGIVARKGVGYNKYKDKGYTGCGCNADFEAGIVLDPFCGCGTTLVVAKKLGRSCIGFDINPSYVEMAQKRVGEISLI